jgi:GR25 family glycosyltransferase involved in LPS biosynthesis
MQNIKTYCINLNRRPDRWAMASTQFEKHGLEVERFAAVDGNEIPGKESLTLKPGLYVCTASHFLLIQRAKYLRLPMVMVFEDDVVLHDNFNSILNEVLESLPLDWQMLIFGGSHKIPPTKMVWMNFQRCNKTLTTHGYIVKESLYDTLLEGWSSMQYPVDEITSNLQQSGNVYITEPPIAWQREGYSDIENSVVSYPWIKTNTQ